MSKELAFSSENLKRFQALVGKYERPASALLPTLYIAQEQFGYLSTEAMDYVAKLLDLPPAHVVEVVNFYTMYKKKDMGEYCLQVCNNITCTMLGSEEILKVIDEELGIKPGEVTSDKKFSCMIVQCLGSCDTAPVVQINEDYFENESPAQFREKIRAWKQGGKPESTQTKLRRVMRGGKA